MKITVDTDHLREAVKLVAPAVPKRPTGVAAMSGVRIHATTKTVEVTATDFDYTIDTEVDAVIGEPGTAVIPHRLFAALVSKMGAGPVDLSVTDETASLTADRMVSEIRCLDASQWPKRYNPDSKASTSTTFDADTWGRIAALAPLAIDPKEGRPILEAIHLADGHAAVTDSHMLGWVDDLDHTLDALIPARALASVDADDQPVAVTSDGRLARIATHAATHTFRLIEGDYPNWRSLVPASTPHSLTVDIEALTGALAATGVINDRELSSTPVVLRLIDDGLLEASSRARDVGSVEAVVSCEGDWPDLVAFNRSYLSTMLALVDSERVVFGATDNLKPVTIADEGGTTVGLLMPIRMPS